MFSTIHYQGKKPYLKKELNFFNARFPATIATILSSIISVILAFNGYTITALILWKLLQYFFEVIILSYLKILMVHQTIGAISKKLIRYSTPLLLSNIIIYFYWNIVYLIVEKLLGKEQLGYYWLAFQLGLFILRIKDAIINVVLPVYSDVKYKNSIKDNFNEVSSIIFKTFAYIFLFFLFFGEIVFINVFGENGCPHITLF